jgi:hypothetical protein
MDAVPEVAMECQGERCMEACVPTPPAMVPELYSITACYCTTSRLCSGCMLEDCGDDPSAAGYPSGRGANKHVELSRKRQNMLKAAPFTFTPHGCRFDSSQTRASVRPDRNRLLNCRLPLQC